LKRLALALAILAAGVAQPASSQAPQLAPWVNDARFPPVFDMYWRARLLHRYAGDRLCAIPNSPHYDDPRSQFRPLNERMEAAAARIEVRWPRALNDVARPYRMPPSQGRCEDESAAWQTLFGFETAVVALERLIDDVERRELNGAVRTQR
jgi:hypothetical protein